MKWEAAISDYEHYLKIERGLSHNSVANYILDVKKLLLFLNNNAIVISPLKIDKEIVQRFIYDIAKDINARSQARIISGLKSFFN